MLGHTDMFVSGLFAAWTGIILMLMMYIRGAAWLLWGGCLAPLFLLGRAYALVGISPIHLMDMLAFMALLAVVGEWAPRAFSEDRLRGFRAVAILLAAMTIQAVYRGVAAHYPDPLKGVILGLYPVYGWFAATWLLTRSGNEIARWRWVLYVPTLGILLQMVFHTALTPAATGLYLAIAGAFGVQLRRLGDSRLLVWTLLGAAALTAVASKRGPFLAVAAAIAATYAASRSSRRKPVRLQVISWFLGGVALVAALAFFMSGSSLSEAPVVGGLAARLESSVHDPDSESANNVELRFAMWKHALKTVAEEPLFGAGAGYPMDITFEGSRLNDPKSGPHNSFIGYIFYLGWPAGIAVIFFVCATLRRTWRARQHLVAASWFGATVGVCLTAFTNVAFETTFIGLPSWLVLACAYALVGVPRGDETEKLPHSEHIARRHSFRHAEPAQTGRLVIDSPTMCPRA